MVANNNTPIKGELTRRDALKGMAAVGAGAVGTQVASESAEAGAVSGGCIADWPDAMDDRIQLDGDQPAETGHIPQSGDLVIYRESRQSASGSYGNL